MHSIVYLLKCICCQFSRKRRIFCRHCLLNVVIQAERPLWKMWRNVIGKNLNQKKKMNRKKACKRIPVYAGGRATDLSTVNIYQEALVDRRCHLIATGGNNQRINTFCKRESNWYKFQSPCDNCYPTPLSLTGTCLLYVTKWYFKM